MINYTFILFLLTMLGCSSENTVLNEDEVPAVQETPICAKGNHTNEIIPIIYGEPSHKLLEKADSGLVYLGGCEIAGEHWYCKMHKEAF